MAGYDLTRNGIDYDGPVLFGLYLDDGANCGAASRYPDRPAYVYRWSRAESRGSLSPLACR
jgi:hypothetical protein